MKYFLLFCIHAYWKIIPVKKRRTCLFNVSCSHHVYQETLNYGIIKGVKALHYRFNACRNGYKLYVNPITDQVEMLLVNGDVVGEEIISGKLVVEWSGIFTRAKI